MDVLRIAGDVLWILALSLMAGASRTAWRRIDPGAYVPLVTASAGRVLARAPRGLALSLIPAIAFVVGIVLLIVAASHAPWTQQAIILFGARATLAALFAMAHLRWLAGAMGQLAREGALKP
jgi:hypothetical protein